MSLNGADFVVVCPPNRAAWGENFTLRTKDGVVVRVGESCERLPATSLPALERAGMIRRREEEEEAPSTTTAPREPAEPETPLGDAAAPAPRRNARRIR